MLYKPSFAAFNHIRLQCFSQEWIPFQTLVVFCFVFFHSPLFSVQCNGMVPLRSYQAKFQACRLHGKTTKPHYPRGRLVVWCVGFFLSVLLIYASFL